MFRYRHLQNIINMILEENPENPLENFEEFSRKLKRRYIQKEVYLESVFVDSINRSECNNSLQMYKVIKMYSILFFKVNLVQKYLYF